MKALYPAIKPFAQHTVKMPDGHELYIEEVGSPHGLPVLFLHGGPGAGCSEDDRRFFDPEKYHIILFDQRGCGRSTPFASLENNTTQHLILDIERIRQFLVIDKWMIFGGSWGSTLGLLYAQAYPQRVIAMILRGIFLCEKRDLHWFYQEGASFIFPEAWAKYLKPIPFNERHDLVNAYYSRLTSEDAQVRSEAAKAWAIWEGSTSKLYTDPAMIERFGGDDFALAFARIECHYFINKGFFEEDGWLLKNVEKIRHIPTWIVQGRYDVVCPATSAHELHSLWPESELFIISDAGHSASEPGIKSKLIEATNYFGAMT